MDIKRILLTTDFSEFAEGAFGPAAAIARRWGASIDLVNVAGSLPPMAWEFGGAGIGLDEFYADLRSRIAGLAKRPELAGIRIETHVLEGYGAESVSTFQQEGRHDLLVTATHGYAGLRRLLLGSFAERLVRLMDCPVLTVRRQRDAEEFHPRRILFPYDFSELSRAAIPYVRGFAETYGSEVVVLHVVHADLYPVPEFPAPMPAGSQFPVYWEKAQSHAAEELESFVERELSGLDARAEVAVGTPVAEIAGKASETGAELVVLSTHGRTGLRHALVGSVAERVVRGAPSSVLTIRPRESTNA